MKKNNFDVTQFKHNKKFICWKIQKIHIIFYLKEFKF